MILQCAGHNFRGWSRTVIDNHHNRQPFGNIAFFGGVFDCIFFIAWTGRNDFTLIQEQIGNVDCLVKQAARIVAYVDNNAFQFVAQFLFGIFNCLGGHRVDIFAERGNADINHVIGFDAVFNRLYFNFLAFEGNFQRFFVNPANGQFDFAADFAAHFINRIVQRHAHHGFAVNIGNIVARF